MFETTKDLWLGDGTFKQYLDLFYQKYTIHIRIGGYSPSCLYALLPNKTEKTYIDFNQALLQLGPNANTEKNNDGFREGGCSSVFDNVPTCALSPLSIRSAQNNWSRPERKLIQQPRNWRYLWRWYLQLLFIQVVQVREGFNLVTEEVDDIFPRFKSDIETSRKVEQFVCCFQKTYLMGTSRAPIFEPSIWSQDNAASEELAETKIADQGWHYELDSVVSGLVIRIKEQLSINLRICWNRVSHSVFV